MDAVIDTPDKGAWVGVLQFDGSRMNPAESLEGGSDGGRQRLHRIWLPLAVESSDQQHGNSNSYSPLPKVKPELDAGAATGVGVSDKSYQDDVSDSLEQDIERGNVENSLAIGASLEGGSAGEIQRINHILAPVPVQSLAQQPDSQPDNSSHNPHLAKGKEISLVGATAWTAEREKVESRVVKDRDCYVDISDLDIEKGTRKGNVQNVQAIGVAKAAESGPTYSHQPDNDDDSVCRICQMNSKSSEIIDLGCACKCDLGQVHKKCADTWFAFRGNLGCEICGEIAQNLKTPGDIMMEDNRGENSDTHCTSARRACIIRLSVICLLWVAVIFVLYKIFLPQFRKETTAEGSY